MMRELENFIPPALRGRMVIAGGYAVNPYLAGDVDLWILGGPEPLEDIATEVEEHLREAGIAFEGPEPTAYDAERMLIATVKKGYEGKDVQVLATAFSDAESLVNSFDLSTHMLGKHLTSEGSMKLYFGKHYTRESEPIRILRFSTPVQTMERVLKLAERYNTTPVPEQFEKLRLLAQRTGWQVAA